MQSFFPLKDHFSNPFMIGTVEDNKDPLFNYRIKVRLPNLHNETITTEQLPWAAKVDCSFMGVGDEQDLKHAVPEIGTQVLVLIMSGDPNSLVYLGNLYKKTAQTPSDNKYNDTYGVYRKDGQFIGIDKIQKLFQMLFDGDIEVDKVHNIKVNASNDITITCNNANITTNGQTNITANGNMNVTAPTSTFNGNVEVTGIIHAAGNIDSDAEVGAMGGSVHLSTHTHPFPYNAGPSPAQGQTEPGTG